MSKPNKYFLYENTFEHKYKTLLMSIKHVIKKFLYNKIDSLYIFLCNTQTIMY